MVPVPSALAHVRQAHAQKLAPIGLCAVLLGHGAADLPEERTMTEASALTAGPTVFNGRVDAAVVDQGAPAFGLAGGLSVAAVLRVGGLAGAIGPEPAVTKSDTSKCARTLGRAHRDVRFSGDFRRITAAR